MKRVLVLASLVILGSGVGQVFAAPCAPASLADYVSLDASGCTTGDVTLSLFAVEPFPGPAATQIDPAGVTLTPLANSFSLSSGGAVSAAADELVGLRFGFRVSAAAGLTRGTVALGQTEVAPDGAITAILDAGAAGNAIAFDSGVEAAPVASFASPGTSFFDIFFELGIDGGLAGHASAGPNVGAVSFAVVPEPGTLLLLMLGLPSLLLLLRARTGRERT